MSQVICGLCHPLPRAQRVHLESLEEEEQTTRAHELLRVPPSLVSQPSGAERPGDAGWRPRSNENHLSPLENWASTRPAPSSRKNGSLVVRTACSM